MTITTDEARNNIMEKFIKPNIEAALPDVEVEFEPGGGGGDFVNKMKTYNASGDLPDVWYGDSTLAPPIMEAGNLLDLTPYVTKDHFIDKYSVPDALKAKDGKVYALSSGSDTYFTPVIYYHVDMFEKAGVQIPKTFDELVKAAQTLKSKGFVPISTPGKGGWSTTVFLFQNMVQIGDPQAMADLVTNKTDFNNPSIKAGLARVEQLAKSGALPEGVANLDYGPAKELFTSKKAAMYMMMTWELPDLAKDPTVDFFPFPAASDKYDSAKVAQFWGAPLNGYSVNAKSKNVEQAVKVAEFLAMADAKYFESTGAPVALKTGNPTGELQPLMKKFLDWYNAVPTKIASYSINAQDAKVAAEFATLGQNLLTGQYTSDQFVKDFDKTWKENTWFK
ncbi:extracellular solute-binding protein [Cohnella sp. NL03-T5]|nr:extracellular solute-binding protein [Cohnella silvisoli]